MKRIFCAEGWIGDGEEEKREKKRTRRRRKKKKRGALKGKKRRKKEEEVREEEELRFECLHPTPNQILHSLRVSLHFLLLHLHLLHLLHHLSLFLLSSLREWRQRDELRRFELWTKRKRKRKAVWLKKRRKKKRKNKRKRKRKKVKGGHSMSELNWLRCDDRVRGVRRAGDALS